MIVDPCTLTTITSTSITDYTYDISELTTDQITSLSWIQSNPSCLIQITYVV